MTSFNVIIPCAGEATRLRPITNNISKAMVRVNGKPCIDYILEFLISQNVNQIVIVDGKFDDIRNYVSRRYPNLNVIFTKPSKKDGPGNSVFSGISQIEDKLLPLLIWLGDTILLEKELPIGENFLVCKEMEMQSSWCVYDGKNFYDKPKENISDAKALVGVYGFKTCPYLKEDTYPEISHILTWYSDYSNSSYKLQETNEWYDIGELSNYYKTSAELITRKSRNFNELVYDKEIGVLTKTVHHEDYLDVIRDEKQWYNDIGEVQKLFTPRIIKNSSRNSISMTYESGILLSDLLMYEDITPSAWEYILDKIFSTVTKYFHLPIQYTNFESLSSKMWIEKTQNRLEKTLFTIEEKQKIRKLAKKVQKHTSPIEYMIGDLHLGNIIYNTDNDKLIFIDPRGNYGGYSTTIGDNLYDFAKLAHDIILGYNYIVNDIEIPEKMVLEEIFKKCCEKYNVHYESAVSGGIVLLATCIPLHYDDLERQKRMYERVRKFI